MLLRLAVAVVVGFAVAQAATLVTTVFLHRSAAHKALALRSPARFVARLLTWMTTGIKPREWVAVHRKHHATSDTPDDPHSPLVMGFWKVQLLNALLYRRVARDQATVQKYARDLPPDRWDRVLFDRPLVGLGLGVVLLMWALGWWAGLVAAVVHTVSYLGLNAAINAVGHRFGRRHYQNMATNNRWLALITGGEGLHNNHHEAPTSPRLSHRRLEIDPAWPVIKLLVWVRQAELRHPGIRRRRPKAPAAA